MDTSAIRKFSPKPTIFLSPLIFEADDEISAKNGTMQVNCACSDYLSFYAATLPRQNPSALMIELFFDPIQP